tara:strand:+ start:271 stop:651 length:381 start_codon:yes stop_codon:yes gene_type:complete
MELGMYYKSNEFLSESRSRVIHNGEGEIITKSFFRDISRLPVNFDIWELAPGVSEGTHVHEKESALEEIYYFMEGEGVMWIDGEDVPITEGDVILAPEGSDHGFRNTGSSPLKLVILWGKPSKKSS